MIPEIDDFIIFRFLYVKMIQNHDKAIVQSIRDLIDDKDISGSNILRLVCLYAIKYGSQNEQTLRSLSAAACQAKSINRSGKYLIFYRLNNRFLLYIFRIRSENPRCS